MHVNASINNDGAIFYMLIKISVLDMQVNMEELCPLL